MAWLPESAPNASEGKMLRTPTGNAAFFNGAFYVLNSPATSVTNTTTETSLFGGDSATGASAITVQLGQPPFTQYPGSTRVLPQGSLSLGTMFNFDFYGSLQTSGTPNLTLRLGLVGPYPSTTFIPLCTTGAVALTSEASATFAHMEGGISVTSLDTITGTATGSVTAWIGIEYAQTGITIYSPVTVNTLFDTSQQYTLDVRATWSAASSSNILQLSYGDFEVIA